MLSCAKATELIDKRSVTSISCNEKWQLKFHTMMCKACNEYQKQSIILDNILNNDFTGNSHTESEIENIEELKRKILSKLL
jgi:hypothetical protein